MTRRGEYAAGSVLKRTRPRRTQPQRRISTLISPENPRISTGVIIYIFSFKRCPFLFPLLVRPYVARRQSAAISQVTFFYATPSIISFIGVSLAFYFLLKYLSVLLGIISLTYLLFFIIPADFSSVKITCTLEFLPSFRFYYLKLHDSFVYPLSFSSATFVLRSRFPSTNPEAPSSFHVCIIDRYIDIDFFISSFWI